METTAVRNRSTFCLERLLSITLPQRLFFGKSLSILTDPLSFCLFKADEFRIVIAFFDHPCIGHEEFRKAVVGESSPEDLAGGIVAQRKSRARRFFVSRGALGLLSEPITKNANSSGR